MTAYALRLANGQDSIGRVRAGDALGLTPGSSPRTARSGVRPDGGGVVAVVAGTMQVTVSPFSAWIDGASSDAQSGYVFGLDAAQTLTLAAGDPVDDRYDAIIARVKDDAFDGSGATTATVEVVQGTPGAGPVASSLLPGTSLALFDVLVPAGVSLGTGGLSSANLGADRRSWLSGLGGVLPVANQSERDALMVQPGAVVYRKDADQLEVWSGTTWRPYVPADREQRGVANISGTATPTRSAPVALDAAIFNGAAPSNVQVTPRDSWADLAHVYVASRSANQFTVGARNIDGGNFSATTPVSVDWVAWV